MKRYGIALISLMIALSLSGCGSPGRGREASTQIVQQELENVQMGLQEKIGNADKEQEPSTDINNGKLKNVEQEVETIINKSKSELEYESTLSEERRDAYKDENGDLYFYKDNGEVVDFIANVDTEKCRAAKANEEDVKEAADIYLENLVEVPSYYQLDRIEYDGYVNLFLVVYVHKSNGVDTTDLVLIGMDNELNLTSFSVPRAYAFKEMDNMEIDVERLEEEALKLYYQKYGDSVMDVKIEDSHLGTDDNENIVYQVAISGSTIMDNGDKMGLPDIIFVPYP